MHNVSTCTKRDVNLKSTQRSEECNLKHDVQTRLIRIFTLMHSLTLGRHIQSGF